MVGNRYINGIKCIAKYIVKATATFFINIHLIDRIIIITVDGGVCSQIHFFLIGRIFAEKGFRVKYDISWFKYSGKDMNGKMVRSFDLLKLFPSLKFGVVSLWEKWLYSKVFLYRNNYDDREKPLEYMQLCAPQYLTGYYRDPTCLYTVLMKKYLHLDKLELDEENKYVLNLIQSKSNSVAVHVRRGDLSEYNVAYGCPASVRYFVNAVNYIEKRCCDGYYFFFSDEPDWVKRHLIAQLPLINNYYIVNINGSDRGYLDLYLISSCKHQITSKGSLGKYGALFSSSENQMITLCNDEIDSRWKQYLNNAVLIEC